MSNKYLLKNVKVADPNSGFNEKTVDVYIEDGIISEIGEKIDKKAKTNYYNNAIIAPGFCDLYANFCDPGYEHREDILSGIKSAIKGGYTAVCTIPDTNPVVQSKASVEYIINKAKGLGVDVYPLGAISEDLNGLLPTEMYDMQQSGAIGFTDAPHSVKNSGLLLRALQYVQPFNGVIFDMSTDESLSNNGHLNEGEVSVRMGLKGISHLAEVVQIKRNIEILRYTSGRLHIFGVTTKEGVKLIKSAKKEGLNITASVFVHHLLFTDEVLQSYGSNYKVIPPFRSARDRNALKEGLLDGIIDCICSQHTPIETEGKRLEFEYALPGIIGLETTYSIVKKAFGESASAGEIIQWLSIHPRAILNLNQPIIDIGQAANFSIIDEAEVWEVKEKSLSSKSKNTPLLGEMLTGRIKAVFNQDKWLLNE